MFRAQDDKLKHGCFVNSADTHLFIGQVRKHVHIEKQKWEVFVLSRQQRCHTSMHVCLCIINYL